MQARIVVVAPIAIVAFALCACGSSPTRPPATGLRGACAELAAETRAKVGLAKSQTSVDADVDTLLDAIAPYGRCAEPATAAGAWAFEVVDLTVETVEAPSYDDAGEPEPNPSKPAGVRVTARPVFITQDGKRILGKDDIDLPPIDEMIEGSGAEFFPPWPHESQSVEIVLDTDWSGDGVPEALVVGASWMTPLVFGGTSIEIYASAMVLPMVTDALDFDHDGRRDVADDDFFDFDVNGDLNHIQAFRLLAHARADGSFAIDDDAVRHSYAESCADFGRSPWMVTRSDEDALTNIACAMLEGVPGAVISQGFDDELVAMEADGVDSQGHSFLMIGQTEDVRAWAMRPLPITLARTDGMRVLPITKVTTSTSEPTTKAYRFDGTQAIDGDRGTSWQARKSDARPWIELALAEPSKVVALEIANGFQRKDALGDLFAMNRRATSVKVTAGKREVTLTLAPSTLGYQLVRLPEAMTTATLRVTVIESAAGSKWQNVALSEVRLLTQ